MYRRKQHKKQKQYPSEDNKFKQTQHGNTTRNKVRSYHANSKIKRLSQIDKELSDIVFEPEYKIGDRYDKLLLERWQLRYELGL
tara:strand:- start:214 stop:465 length:252 start_codon:yes stop_codon:yes gene_type:complete